jgi:cyanophycinase-like exopeptidase
MGGATENDNAMQWFLEQADGGDVLVLRATGTDGYNDYLFSELEVSLNSVETIVCHEAAASSEAYVLQKIHQAEAIWFAGGDQWDYISFWRNTELIHAVNQAINERNVVVGGTSAGMAIQGGFYFSAENGTVTSEMALTNPFHPNVTVDSIAFIHNEYLFDVITDTHYDNPDRKGRQIVFLSRILLDYNIPAKGIACDEYTAVCINADGMASVYGDYPDYDDNAYFIQTNCELSDIYPENCSAGSALNWNLGNQALKVYAVKGTADGANGFNLTDWASGTGGEWQHWFVDNGLLYESSGTQPNCNPLGLNNLKPAQSVVIYPNPADEFVIFNLDDNHERIELITFYDAFGQVKYEQVIHNTDDIYLDISSLISGLYLIQIKFNDATIETRKILVKP